MMEICRDSNVCGGCTYQGVPYEEQLKNKAGEVRGLMERKDLRIGQMLEIEPAPDRYRYRNKMEYTFGDLEKDKVYEGEGYTVYDVTDLYYTDLEDYLHDFLEDPDCGEWEAIRDAYRNPGNLRFSLLSSED